MYIICIRSKTIKSLLPTSILLLQSDRPYRRMVISHWYNNIKIQNQYQKNLWLIEKIELNYHVICLMAQSQYHGTKYHIVRRYWYRTECQGNQSYRAGKKEFYIADMCNSGLTFVYNILSTAPLNVITKLTCVTKDLPLYIISWVQHHWMSLHSWHV